MENQNPQAEAEIETLNELELEEAAGGICSVTHCSNTGEN